jgi:hypothetical protein
MREGNYADLTLVSKLRAWGDGRPDIQGLRSNKLFISFKFSFVTDTPSRHHMVRDYGKKPAEH